MQPLEAATRAATDHQAGSAANASQSLVVPSVEVPKSYVDVLARMPSTLLTPRNLLIFHLPLAMQAEKLPHAARVFSHWLFGGEAPYPLSPGPAGHRVQAQPGICIGGEYLPVYTLPEEVLTRSRPALKAKQRLIETGRNQIGRLVRDFLLSDKYPCRPLIINPCIDLPFDEWQARSWPCLREDLRALPVDSSLRFGSIQPAYPKLPLATESISLTATTLSSATGPAEADAIFGRMKISAYLLGSGRRVAKDKVTLSKWELYIRAFDVFRFDAEGGRELGCWSQIEGLRIPDTVVSLIYQRLSAGQVTRPGWCLHDHDLRAFSREFAPTYNKLAMFARVQGADVPLLATKDLVVICEIREKFTHPVVEVKIPMGPRK